MVFHGSLAASNTILDVGWEPGWAESKSAVAIASVLSAEL